MIKLAAYDTKKGINVTILQFICGGANITLAVCMKPDGTLYEEGIKNLVIKE